jgi:phenylacetate-CoA ligase
LLERFLLDLILVPLAGLRWLLELSHATYAILMLPQAQPLLEAIGRIRERALYLKARATCPAYARFLAEHGYREKHPWRLAGLPVTTKENYVRKYSIESRCFGGTLRGSGDVIDESSGSSGVPNNWVRNANERSHVKRVLQLSYGLMYGDPRRILLNCFALGPWATGMNVSMSLADVGILKSIGPDANKLENTLRTFGPSYRYIVFGYPPFVKAFVDTTKLDLGAYHLDLVVGGEGISEGLRAYLRRHFKSVVSSYGASDLEINLAAETEWTISLRSRCAQDPDLCRSLFGRDTPPMIFQYNPLDYSVERLEGGEMAFTICREQGAAPKLRYNLKDLGGAYSMRQLVRLLAARGIAVADLAARFGHFPVLFVYGRSDLTAAFFGAKVYPADLEAALLEHPILSRTIGSFQFSSYEDERINRRLAIDLELIEGTPPEEVELGDAELAHVFYRGLSRANQDFREVARMFSANAIDVKLHLHGTGPFAGADIRLKQQYVKRGPE